MSCSCTLFDCFKLLSFALPIAANALCWSSEKKVAFSNAPVGASTVCLFNFTWFKNLCFKSYNNEYEEPVEVQTPPIVYGRINYDNGVSLAVIV